MNLSFYEEAGRLKTLPRTGWVLRGIPNPESIADHMYRSQLIAYDLAKALRADPVYCAHMMMIHDLPEARAGDITPYCNVSKADKHARELKAAKELAVLSGNPEFVTVFLEYQAKQTLPAKICNDADKLECLIQALEYARLYPAKRPQLESFWTNVETSIMTRPGKEMLAELRAQKHALSPPRPRLSAPGL